VANILLTPLSDGTPAHIRIHFIFLARIVTGLHFPTNDIFVEIFLLWLRNFCLFRGAGRFGRSGSSKVTDVGANRKRVCDFLLVRNSNLVPILHSFGVTIAFMCC